MLENVIALFSIAESDINIIRFRHCFFPYVWRLLGVIADF